MQAANITTALTLPDKRIVRNLGIVRGITVRSRALGGQIAASFQTLFGGNITILTELCEHARQEAFDIMVQHADALGANAHHRHALRRHRNHVRRHRSHRLRHRRRRQRK